MADDLEQIVLEARALAHQTLDAARDQMDAQFAELLNQVKRLTPPARRRRLIALKAACSEFGVSERTMKRYAVRFGAGWQDERGRWSIDADCVAYRLSHLRR